MAHFSNFLKPGTMLFHLTDKHVMLPMSIIWGDAHCPLLDDLNKQNQGKCCMLTYGSPVSIHSKSCTEHEPACKHTPSPPVLLHIPHLSKARASSHHPASIQYAADVAIYKTILHFTSHAHTLSKAFTKHPQQRRRRLLPHRQLGVSQPQAHSNQSV